MGSVQSGCGQVALLLDCGSWSGLPELVGMAPQVGEGFLPDPLGPVQSFPRSWELRV